MENREAKTAKMLIHKVDWFDVQAELKISNPTLKKWRLSGDPNKNEVIDMAVDKIIKKSD